MKRFLSITAFLLVATAGAYAQPLPGNTNNRGVLVPDIDSARREEQLIAIRRAEMSKLEKRDFRTSTARYFFTPQITVINTHSKQIKSVAWEATLTEPATGEVISKYQITSDTRINPGKKKTLKQKIVKPHFRVISATGPRTVANLKTTVTSVTFADGTSSQKP